MDNKISKNKGYKTKESPLNSSFPQYKEFIVFGLISFLFSFFVTQDIATSVIFSELFIWLFFLPHLNSGIKNSNKIDLVLRRIFPLVISAVCFCLIGVDIFTFLITFVLLSVLLIIFKTTRPIECFVMNMAVPFFLFTYLQASSGTSIETLKLFFTVFEDKSFFYLNDKYIFLLGVLLLYCIINVLSLIIKTKKTLYILLGVIALLMNILNILVVAFFKDYLFLFNIEELTESLPTFDYISFVKNNLKLILSVLLPFIVYTTLLSKIMRKEMIFAKRKRIIYALSSLVVILLIAFYLSKKDIYSIQSVAQNNFYTLISPLINLKIFQIKVHC